MTQAFVRAAPAPQLPPPKQADGRVAALSRNLLGSPKSLALTFGALVLVIWAVPDLLRYFIFGAVWHGDAVTCRATDGACWPFIAEKLPYFVYGSYPLDQRWRVDLVFAVGGLLIVWLLAPRAPARRLGLWLAFLVYPVLAFVLLYGWPALGLPRVASDLWGGMLVTLIVSAVGIVVSLPLGILLAFGRRFGPLAVRLTSVAFIEFMRGVPMIAVLFMANTMLPLFLPEGVEPDRLVRPLVGVALFASAYMAEVVRGGLQAIARGQNEAGQALGLRFWAIQRLVILPQVLRLTIPAITNTFIGLFKDTTLVATVGIFDFLRTVDSARLDPNWSGPTITPTAYAFAALVYFVCCFSLSRYAQGLERRLAAGYGRDRFQ
ncbi:amino acid ABC transporter permease [Methylovirgula ligni]|uniref:Amino acid ABC transporter membrane protein 2 (PAAT family) n=1 Tax=Methylovirgula ligni TaxID=569860 RepID=A0A3D9YTG3_9HYPH|nr:amino acid ABC transporter permease [Methylovirgula ligni]QAY96518.1 amino acid ABC transporter permease [Methylovirgula ligni]REF84182.1 amino acid ABC transporter membrane protein 2 (PAAT family) [Methylovirgula ligni]